LSPGQRVFWRTEDDELLEGVVVAVALVPYRQGFTPGFLARVGDGLRWGREPQIVRGHDL